MSILKTSIQIFEVEEFLKENHSIDTKKIEVLKGGEISQVFSFLDGSRNYIIKVRKVRKRFRKADPFGKEITVSEFLTKEGVKVPIPTIVKYGIFKEIKNEKFIFCIVEKAQGILFIFFQKINQF